MKQKKGQFFIVAAIVIVVIILSLVTVSNYIERKDPIKLYDLAEEMKIESQHVLDSGTYDGNDDEKMAELMESFIRNYVDYAGEGKDLYFVFGNKEKINVLAYEELEDGLACVQVGQNSECKSLDLGRTQSFDLDGISNVVVKPDGNDGAEYQFALTEGQNFYFVLSQKTGGEDYVISSSGE